MTLLLREEDVRRVLTMDDAITAVRAALREHSAQPEQNLPRRRTRLTKGVLNVMAATVSGTQSAGLKAYSVSREGAAFLVALWGADSGELLALMEADWLGRMRTGAASGVATDVLARPDSRILAVFGAGKQARTQIEAVAAIRPLDEIRIVTRRPEGREILAKELRAEGFNATPTEDGETAVRHADVVTTITSSAEPVLRGSWLRPGTHVNAAGSNWANRREVDSDTVKMASIITVDSKEQAHIEAGDLILPAEDRVISWSDVHEVGDVLNGSVSGRRGADDITLFKSLGIAMEDVAVARHVFDRALESGLGEQTSFGERPR